MKITIEFNSESDVKVFKAVRDSVTDGVMTPFSIKVCGDDKWFVIDSYTSKSGYGEFYNTKVYLSEVSSPKSKELLAAENFVAKAKKSMEAADQALKAAEDMLESVKRDGK